MSGRELYSCKSVNSRRKQAQWIRGAFKENTPYSRSCSKEEQSNSERRRSLRPVPAAEPIEVWLPAVVEVVVDLPPPPPPPPPVLPAPPLATGVVESTEQILWIAWRRAVRSKVASSWSMELWIWCEDGYDNFYYYYDDDDNAIYGFDL